MDVEKKMFHGNIFGSMKEQEEFCQRWNKVCEAYKYALEHKKEYEEKLRQGKITHVLASAGKTFR